MYVVYCPDCGNNVSFTDAEARSLYQQYQNGYKHYGLPEKIYCTYCKNMHDKDVLCNIVRGED